MPSPLANNAGLHRRILEMIDDGYVTPFEGKDNFGRVVKRYMLTEKGFLCLVATAERRVRRRQLRKDNKGPEPQIVKTKGF